MGKRYLRRLDEGQIKNGCIRCKENVRGMLNSALILLEHQDSQQYSLGIYMFDKLVTSLRTAIEDNGILDKETTSYNDIFDAFRLALRYYKINQSKKPEEQLVIQ